MLRPITTAGSRYWTAVFVLLGTSAMICFAIGLIQGWYVISAICTILVASLAVNWAHLNGRLGQTVATIATGDQENAYDNSNTTLATLALIKENDEQAIQVMDLNERLAEQAIQVLDLNERLLRLESTTRR